MDLDSTNYTIQYQDGAQETPLAVSSGMTSKAVLKRRALFIVQSNYGLDLGKCPDR